MADTKQKNHLGAGLIIAAVMILLHVIYNVRGEGGNQVLFLTTLIPLFVGVIAFIYLEATRTNFAPTFGQQVKFGIKITSVVILALLLFNVAFFKLFPQFKDQIIESRRLLSEQKASGIDDERINEGVANLDRRFLLMISLITIATHLVTGLFASFVGSIISPKRTN